jgi:transposase
MKYKAKRMDEIRLLLQTYQRCGFYKPTARRLQISKNTVKGYVRRAQTVYGSVEQALLANDKELYDALYSAEDKQGFTREEVFNTQLEYWTKELKRVGVSRYLLWQEYRVKHPDGYGYSQFCERLRRYVKRNDLTMVLSHTPGQEMYLDFAGSTMKWVNRESGQVHETQVLVAVLPHSHYTFAIALPSQKVLDFIYGINEALLYFGGVPQAIVSDNLKSYVTKASRYEPNFNELCVQLAAHYQCDLQATRVAKPRDKASVENMVSTVYKRIYAPLRDEVFHSLDDLNDAIRLALHEHNEQPFQKRPGSRSSCFEAEEKQFLSALPNQRFEVKKSTSAKVQHNYHIFLGEEKNYYSVPYQYVGKQASVVYTSKTVEVFVNQQRITTHRRLSPHDTYRYQTLEEHMPGNHQEWQKARGYDAAYFIGQAQKIGPATEWAMGQVLVSRFHQTQSYRSCLGILSLAKKFTPQRLENAAKRCQGATKASYNMLKNILERKLDQEPEQLQIFTPPDHDNIRGPEAYQ